MNPVVVALAAAASALQFITGLAAASALQFITGHVSAGVGFALVALLCTRDGDS